MTELDTGMAETAGETIWDLGFCENWSELYPDLANFFTGILDKKSQI